MAMLEMSEGKSKPQRVNLCDTPTTPYVHERGKTASGLTDLQQSIGNRAVQRLMAKQGDAGVATLGGSLITRTAHVPGVTQRQEEESPMKVEGEASVQRWGPEDEEIQASVMRQKEGAKASIKPPPRIGIHMFKGALGDNFSSLYKGEILSQDAIIKIASKLGMY